MMFEYAAIDRIEGDCVICESNSGMFDLFLGEIPFEVEESDVLLVWRTKNSLKVFKKSERERQRRLKKLRKLYHKANLKK